MYGKQQSNDSVPWVVKDVHGKRVTDVEYKSYSDARDGIRVLRAVAGRDLLFAVRV